MKNNSINFICIISLLALFSTISCLRELSTTIYKIEEKLNDEIIKGNVELENDIAHYLSYDLASITSENNMAFTIHNSVDGIKLNIECILSTSTEDDKIVDEFASIQNSICDKYEYSNNQIVNVIVSLKDYTTGSKLYLKISSSSNSEISLYFRKANSYQTNIPETINYPFAYLAIYFNAKEYYKNNKQILVSSSEANSLIFYAHSKGEILQIDETSLLAISEQSLAAHFWDYDKVILFIGNKNSDSSEESININLKEINDINIYYYMGSDLGLRFFSFYNDCQKEKSEHYLFVNYASLSTKNDLYFKFHNLIGEEVLLADFYPEIEAIQDLNFVNIKKFNSFSKTKYNIHVFKFKCSSKDNKILANIKYAEMGTAVDNGKAKVNQISDFYQAFPMEKFTLDYSDLINSKINEFVMEIFTTNTEEEKYFNINFEKEGFEMNNKFKHIFKITDTINKTLTITRKEDSIYNTIISISPSTSKTEEGTYPEKYFTIHNFKNITGGELYSYYEIEHEYNTNYTINLKIKNKKEYTIPICYYLYTSSLLQICSQNCFLLPDYGEKYLSFKNIFKENKDVEFFNIEEPKYSIIIYNYNPNGDDYSFEEINIKTDLPSSTPINKAYYDHNFEFLDYEIKNLKNTYFNLDLPNVGKENHIDLYILTDLSNNDKFDFEFQCISAYEIALDFVEPLFTQDNNLCYVINKDDSNSKVFHIILNNVSQKENEKIIIRIMPKTKTSKINIKFVIDKNEYIRNNFSFEENIKELDEASVYKIYEINKSTIEEYFSNNNKSIVLYSQDEIKFYARNENEFTKIKNGNFLVIDKDILKEKNYDKFLLIFGRDNCKVFCESKLYYQLTLNNILYDTIDKFEDNYRFKFHSDECKSNEDHYLLLDYGQKYGKNIYLSNYTVFGNIQNVHFINTFSTNNYLGGEKPLLKDYQELEENDFHVYIIKFNCNNNLFSYFDFYSKNDTNTEIQLKPGNVQHLYLRNGTNFTFTFDFVYEIEIHMLNNIFPQFHLKNMTIEPTQTNTVTLIREREEAKSFKIETPKNKDILLRIIPNINAKNLTKTEKENIYKLEDKYIYDIPTNVLNFTIIIKRQKSNLRLLKEENEEEEIEVCYYIGESIILDDNVEKCFKMVDNYEFKYGKPENDSKLYMTFYSKDKNKQIYVESLKTYTDDNENNEGGNNDKKNKNDKKGVSWVVVLLIILLIIVAIALIILIIIRKTKKTITSEDIEKNIKEPTPMVNV